MLYSLSECNFGIRFLFFRLQLFEINSWKSSGVEAPMRFLPFVLLAPIQKCKVALRLWDRPTLITDTPTFFFYRTKIKEKKSNFTEVNMLKNDF